MLKIDDYIKFKKEELTTDNINKVLDILGDKWDYGSINELVNIKDTIYLYYDDNIEEYNWSYTSKEKTINLNGFLSIYGKGNKMKDEKKLLKKHLIISAKFNIYLHELLPMLEEKYEIGYHKDIDNQVIVINTKSNEDAEEIKKLFMENIVKDIDKLISIK